MPVDFEIVPVEPGTFAIERGALKEGAEMLRRLAIEQANDSEANRDKTDAAMAAYRVNCSGGEAILVKSPNIRN